jgi:hypothetical protein
MATTVHRPLKIIPINANGIGRKRYELRKQLQDVALLSETHFKPHEKFFIPNCHFYLTDPYRGRKAELPLQLEKASLTTLQTCPPFSVEATGICIPTGNNEVILAAVYEFPGRAWNDADIIELLSFKHKNILAGDLNDKHTLWSSTAETLQVRN